MVGPQGYEGKTEQSQVKKVVLFYWVVRGLPLNKVTLEQRSKERGSKAHGDLRRTF